MGLFSALERKLQMPRPDAALSGRATSMALEEPHHVLKTQMRPDYPPGTERALFGMGCFWGAERLFWEQPGIHVTAVGYAAGYTPNPTYEEVCSGLTGHNEVVLVVYWPNQISYEQLLKLFFENHNPTQGMRQANDRGTQYRSGIYFYSDLQRRAAAVAVERYGAMLAERGLTLTTEVLPASEFYFAETYHQQYLAKNPGGYCNLQTLAKTGLPELEELVD